MQLCFTHLDVEYTLHWMIVPDKVTLASSASDKLVLGAKAVLRKLADVGLPAAVLDASVFQRQNKIDALFSAAPADRAALYQRMLRIDEIVKKRDAADKYRAQIALDEEVQDTTPQLRAELDQLKERRAELKKLYEAAEKNVPADDLVEKARARVAGFEARAAAVTARDEALDVLDRTDAAIAGHAGLPATLKRLRAGLATLTPERQEAVRLLEQYRAWKAAKGALADYKATRELLAEAKGKLKALVVPAAPDPEERKSVSDRLAQLASALSTDQSMVKALKGLQGKKKCPTCTADIDPKLLPTLEKRIQETSIEQTRVTQEKKRLDLAADARDRALEQKASLEKAVAGYEAKVKVAPKGVDFQPKTSLPKIRDVRARVTQHNQAVKQYRTAKGKLASLQATRAEQAKAYGKAQAAVDACCAEDPQALSDAKAFLGAAGKAKTEVDRIAGQRREARKAYEKKEAELAELAEKLAKNATVRQALDSLDRVLEAFHHTKLPRRVTQACLKDLQPVVNRNVAMLGGGFACEATADLDLVVQKSGAASPRSVRNLSIGERVKLSICFWLAQLELFAADMGILTLDEPTANLDEANRRHLGEALSLLSRSVRNRLQVVVISHDPALRPAFDRVVEVSP